MANFVNVGDNRIGASYIVYTSPNSSLPHMHQTLQAAIDAANDYLEEFPQKRGTIRIVIEQYFDLVVAVV